MKQKVGPVAIGIAVVVVIILLAVLYRASFPPMPRSDLDKPNGMPMYAQKFINARKAGERPPGAPGGPSGAMGGAQQGGSMPMPH